MCSWRRKSPSKRRGARVLRHNGHLTPNWAGFVPVSVSGAWQSGIMIEEI